ncbi:hypothetical protein DTW68_04430 [Vibrio harveyi]|nr:hypothetical protein DTW68_04430 [Vibrio harveyi]
MVVLCTKYSARRESKKLERFFLLFSNFSSQISLIHFFLFFSKASEIRVVNRSNFERTTWFSETSETATSENQLEKSPWQ